MGKFPLMPEQASRFATEMDLLFFVLVLLTIAFTAPVGALVIYFALKYKRGRHVDRSNPPGHSSVLEITWSVIPLLLGLGVFVWAAKLFATVYNPPKDAMEVFVVGKQWMWHLQHANGIRENNELHVPVGRPVRLTMISQDVIHSFFIPEFRVKRDVIPGRYSTMWFEATKPGVYHIFCAEYCGTNHSEMTGKVYAMAPRDFQLWYTHGGPGGESPVPAQTLAQAGADLYTQLNCGSCHGLADSPRGPSLVGIYGKTRKLKGGGTAVADNAYLRESILEPGKRLTAGYEDRMPVYKGQLTEENVLQLIAYIKGLGTNNTQTQSPLSGVNESDYGTAAPNAGGTNRRNTDGNGNTPTNAGNQR